MIVEPDLADAVGLEAEPLLQLGRQLCVQDSCIGARHEHFADFQSGLKNTRDRLLNYCRSCRWSASHDCAGPPHAESDGADDALVC